MTQPISSELIGRILALGAQKWSRFVIVKELKKQNINVSQTTVSNVLRNHNNETANQGINAPAVSRKRRPTVCTPQKVNKIKNYIASDNPSTQRVMGARIEASQSSICK